MIAAGGILLRVHSFRFFVVLGLVGCALLAACTGGRTGSTSSRRPKLGFVLATLNEERYAKDRRYFEEAAAKAGATVEFAACDDNVSVQAAKVEALLAKGVDALVLQPVNGEAASSLVALARRDGVPVIAYDRLIRNAEIDWYVTQDSFRVGELQAQAAVAATGGKGKYVVLMGEAGHSVAEEITRGVMSVLLKYPDVHVVVKQAHPGWSTAAALTTTENALTRYQNAIQAVLANNDGMALGAVRAIEEQKLTGKVFVAGADADLTAVREVLRGRQSMTVLKGIQPLAQAAVSVAVALARKEKPSADGTVNNGRIDVPTTHTPVVAITRDNVEREIIETGFHPASLLRVTEKSPEKAR
jgi:D-xylose transport system substrate-binding protein